MTNTRRSSHLAWMADYEALVAGAGLVDFSNRSLIAVIGRDRATFLHNFCTNEVRSLAVGDGREAFVLNAQGKTIGHVHVFVDPERIVVETSPLQAAKLIAHFDRYIIREDVSLSDLADQRVELFLSGGRAAHVLGAVFRGELPAERLASRIGEIDDTQVFVRRSYLVGDSSYWIECDFADRQRVAEALLAAGAVMVTSREAFEAARIESGSPIFGQDISDQNLPQELARDNLAISFVKGCYLGQETVARIDALGHVNRSLRGVAFDKRSVNDSGDNAYVPPGTQLLAAMTPIGVVTSVCYSPKLNQTLALAFVKRGFDTVGSEVSASLATALDVEIGDSQPRTESSAGGAHVTARLVAVPL